MINLITLTKSGTVTSPFGLRKAPTAGASTRHNGIDLVLKDPNIPAVLGGTVTNNTFNRARGNYVTIRQSDGTTATYQHLAKKSPWGIGSTINEGDIIGLQGSSGISTGAHLHFEVSKNGSFINPQQYLSGGKTIELDGYGRPIKLDEPISDVKTLGIKNSLMNIMGDLIIFVVVVLIIVFAVVLFMKSFDIKLPF